MDLSNRETAEYWFKQAKEITDPDLRKEALATFRKFRQMALREERMRLRHQRPGYGVRSLLVWIVSLALIVIATLVCLSKIFSGGLVFWVSGAAMGVCIVAAAIVLRVYGYISEQSMLEMIRNGTRRLNPPDAGKPAIEANAIGEGEPSEAQCHLPSDSQAISFDTDEGTDDK